MARPPLPVEDLGVRKLRETKGAARDRSLPPERPDPVEPATARRLGMEAAT